MKDPEKTIPRATMIGSGATMLLYLVSSIAPFGMIASSTPAKSTSPLADGADVIFGGSRGGKAVAWWRRSRSSACSTAGSCCRASCRFIADRQSFSRVNLARSAVIALLALAYSSWAIWGASFKPLTEGLILPLGGIPVFLWVKWLLSRRLPGMAALEQREPVMSR